MTQTNRPGIGEERVPWNETDQIEEIVAILRSIQERKDRRQRPVQRNVHGKQHGCLYAELTIEPELPEQFRHGIFRTPRTYPSLVRFSNSKQRDDRLPDGHGMAIKLFEVEGEKVLSTDPDARTQDFVLVDHPVFFARDVAEMVPLVHDFERVMIGDVLTKAGTVLKALASQEQCYRLLRKMGSKRPDSVLEIQYWSTTPLRLGPGAMKVSVLPHLDTLPSEPARSADKLRVAMSNHLSRREARFDFLIQPQVDPARMPIEDASVPWDEAASPFRKVGTLRIPQQSFERPEQMAFGEALSFTPWHCIEDHRPLGGINRARRKVYELMSARRRESNGVAPVGEPTLEEVRRVVGVTH